MAAQQRVQEAPHLGPTLLAIPEVQAKCLLGHFEAAAAAALLDMQALAALAEITPEVQLAQMVPAAEAEAAAGAAKFLSAAMYFFIPVALAAASASMDRGQMGRAALRGPQALAALVALGLEGPDVFMAAVVALGVWLCDHAVFIVITQPTLAAAAQSASSGLLAHAARLHSHQPT